MNKMSYLQVSYTGSVTRDAEIRINDEKPYLFFVTEADGSRFPNEAAASIRVDYFADDAEALAPRLTKHTEVYIEGRLVLWEGTGQRTGLSVVALRVDVLGQRGQVIEIGRARE